MLEDKEDESKPPNQVMSGHLSRPSRILRVIGLEVEKEHCY